MTVTGADQSIIGGVDYNIGESSTKKVRSSGQKTRKSNIPTVKLENQPVLSTSSTPQPKSFLDSLMDAGLSITTRSERDPMVGFLQELQPVDRRIILGQHDTHCRQARHEIFLQDYLQQELAQTDDIDASLAVSVAQACPTYLKNAPLMVPDTPSSSGCSGGNGKRKYSISSDNSQSEDRKKAQQSVVISRNPIGDCLSDVITPSPAALLVGGDDDAIQTLASATYTEVTRSSANARLTPSAMVRLFEPEVLRTSIYQKYVSHFQHFYNDHDTDSLFMLLLNPCCHQQMVRGMKLWSTKPLDSVNFKGPKPWSLTPALEDADTAVEPPSSSGTVSSNSGQLTLMRQVIMQGIENYHTNYSYIFKTLPDCIKIYESTKITYDEKTNSTVVTSPFTYFLTLSFVKRKAPFPSTTVSSGKRKDDSSSQSDSSHSDTDSDVVTITEVLESTDTTVAEQSLEKTKQVRKLKKENNKKRESVEEIESAGGKCYVRSVRVVMKGYNVLHFNEQGLVVSDIDHYRIISCSDPSFTEIDFINFLGY